MLPDFAVAVFLTICLAVFVTVNLYNLKKSGSGKRGVKYEAEVEQPTGLVFALAALGTVVFFLETVLYIVLVFAGVSTIISNSALQFQFPYDSHVQLIGIFMISFGYGLFIWSVLVRGRYATSWRMPENQELVTWGPYRHVRHPSYLAYFILFIGLFLTLLNMVAVFPLIAIPGYIRITTVEEELLTKRFGEAYLEYKRKTGRFLPKRKM